MKIFDDNSENKFTRHQPFTDYEADDVCQTCGESVMRLCEHLAYPLTLPLPVSVHDDDTMVVDTQSGLISRVVFRTRPMRMVFRL